MRALDRRLSALQRWVRAQPLLYRLTLGTRVLLAVGIIPTGMVKLLATRSAIGADEGQNFYYFMRKLEAETEDQGTPRLLPTRMARLARCPS